MANFHLPIVLMRRAPMIGRLMGKPRVSVAGRYRTVEDAIADCKIYRATYARQIIAVDWWIIRAGCPAHRAHP